MSQTTPAQQYDKPATFVNVKRVRQDKDSKGREQTVLTFGLTKNKDGEEINTCDDLIAALLPYKGKQVNLDVRMEEKTSAQGRKFPSAFVRVVEMIPKEQGTVGFVAKTQTKSETLKATAAKIQQDFEKK